MSGNHRDRPDNGSAHEEDPPRATGLEAGNRATGSATADDLAERVRAVVADALARPLAQVQLESRLMADLGAESLDFLDIVFRLEHEFGIQITRGEMERAARGDMSDEEFAPNGIVSDAGLARLRELMPEASELIVPGLRRMQILSLFSVQTFVSTVRAKQQGRSV